MTRKRKAIWGALFFIGGIFTASFFDFEVTDIFVGIFFTLMLFLFFRKPIFLFILFFLVGWWRTAGAEITVPNFQAEFQEFQARVVFVDKKFDSLQLTAVINSGQFVDQKVLLITERYPLYNHGDILHVSCKLQKPEPFEDFAYDKYLALRNIHLTCLRPNIKVLGQQKNIISQAFVIKEYISHALNQSLPEPESALIRAMLINERNELPKKLLNDFSQTGLTHIISISGLHMAVIVYILREVLLMFGFSAKRTFWVIAQIIFLYLIVIGLPASAVRSGLLALLLLLSLMVQRRCDGLYTLIIAAAAMSVINPLAVRYDIGWQLSFLAVLGLILWVKKFESWLVFIPERNSLRTMVAVTLSAQMYTWPVIVYYFGIVSFISPLTNILIVPTLPAVMILSLLLPLVTLVPLVGIATASLLYIIIHAVIMLVELIARFSGYIMINNFSASWLIGSFLMIAILTYIIKPYENNN